MRLFMIRLQKMVLHQKRTLLLLWMIVSNFLFFFGGAINPLTAGEQFRRRMHLPSLLDRRNPDVSLLNEAFEQFLQESEQYAKTRDQFSSLAEYEAHMVEIFTFLNVKHTSDLMQYLTVEHLPTVGEIMRSGVDDSDGRTIFVTTLLLYRGYDAWALFGPWHSWVEVVLENGIHLQILEKIGIGMNFWYLRFNDRKVHFNPAQTLVFVCFELFLAALIVLVLFFIWKTFSQSSFIRGVTKSLSIFAVATMILFLVSLAIVLLLYRILWGV